MPNVVQTSFDGPCTYDGFRDWLEVHPDGHLAHNTWIVLGQTHDGRGTISVRFHGTRILTYIEDGAIIIDTGFYRTATTKQRLNQFGPKGWVFRQRRWQWYVWKNGTEFPLNPLEDVEIPGAVPPSRNYNP